MSMGRASGMNVLEGALRSFSVEGPGRIGEVDLPREGMVLPYSAGIVISDGMSGVEGSGILQFELFSDMQVSGDVFIFLWR